MLWEVKDRATDRAHDPQRMTKAREILTSKWNAKDKIEND